MLANGDPPVPTYLDSRVQTDFIFSIANGQDPNLRTLMDLFGMTLHQLQLESLRIKRLTGPPLLEPKF